MHIPAILCQRLQGLRHGGQFAGERQLGADCVELLEIVAQERLAGAGQRQVQRFCGDVGIPVAVTANPTSKPQKTGRPDAQQSFPTCIQCRHHRQEDISQVCKRRVDFVGDVQAFVPQRSSLPQQCDLRGNGLLDQLAGGGFAQARIALPHQCRDSVAMIEHALAHHFGGVSGQHRRDQSAIEQRDNVRPLDPLAIQEIQRRCKGTVFFSGRTLPVLGKIGEHGKKHEAADECDGLVQ